MPGFATYDAIVNALTTGQGQARYFNKAGLGGTITATNAYDLWTAAGQPVAGTYASVSGTGVARDNTTAGAMGFTAPVSPATLHGLSVGAGSTVTLGTLLLYDRLIEYPFTSNAAATINMTSPAVPARDANAANLGAGVQMMLHSTTATARAAVTVTVTYVNSAGTAGRVSAATNSAGTAAVGSLSNPAGQPFFWPLAAGDTGVRTITSIQISATMTATPMCMSLIRPIAYLPIMAANSYVERDLVLQLASLPRIPDGAALGLAVLANTTSTPCFGQIQAAAG
jgi:hypothetical protein